MWPQQMIDIDKRRLRERSQSFPLDHEHVLVDNFFNPNALAEQLAVRRPILGKGEKGRVAVRRRYAHRGVHALLQSCTRLE
jgi:hypothetical protein